MQKTAIMVGVRRQEGEPGQGSIFGTLLWALLLFFLIFMFFFTDLSIYLAMGALVLCSLVWLLFFRKHLGPFTTLVLCLMAGGCIILVLYLLDKGIVPVNQYLSNLVRALPLKVESSITLAVNGTLPTLCAFLLLSLFKKIGFPLPPSGALMGIATLMLPISFLVCSFL